MRDHFETTQRWFVEAAFGSEPATMRPSPTWTDDEWFADQDQRVWRETDGWWPVQPGGADGRIIGGNLCTLNLLQGTPCMPDLDGAVLFVEDDAQSDRADLARNVTSLLQLPGIVGLRGLAIGRFQQASRVTRPLVEEIVARQPALAGLPVLANLDFGHTLPMWTFPIGGTVSLTVGERSSVVRGSG